MTDEFDTEGLIADLTPQRIDALVNRGKALQSAAIRDSIRGMARSLWFFGRKDYTPAATAARVAKA